MAAPHEERPLLAILAGLRIGLSALWTMNLVHSADAAGFSRELWQPISLARAFPQFPSVWFLEGTWVLAIATALLLMAGAWTRITGPSTVVFGALAMSCSMSFGKLSHDSTTCLLAMMPLCLSRWGERAGWDAWRASRLGPRRDTPACPRARSQLGPETPLVLAYFALALPYASAAANKLAVGAFLADGMLARTLKRRLLLAEFDVVEMAPWVRAISTWLLDRPALVELLAWGALLGEGGFWLGLVSRRLRIAALGGALMLHAAIFLLTGIPFRSHVGVLLALLAACGAWEFCERRRRPVSDAPCEPGDSTPARRVDRPAADRPVDERPEGHWRQLSGFAAAMAAILVWIALGRALPAGEPWGIRRLTEHSFKQVFVRPPDFVMTFAFPVGAGAFLTGLLLAAQGRGRRAELAGRNGLASGPHAPLRAEAGQGSPAVRLSRRTPPVRRPG